MTMACSRIGLGGGQVLLQEQGRERQHVADVVEAVADVVVGEVGGRLEVDADQVADRVVVLGPVEPADRDPADVARARCSRTRRASRRRPGVAALGLGGSASAGPWPLAWAASRRSGPSRGRSPRPRDPSGVPSRPDTCRAPGRPCSCRCRGRSSNAWSGTERRPSRTWSPKVDRPDQPGGRVLRPAMPYRGPARQRHHAQASDERSRLSILVTADCETGQPTLPEGYVLRGSPGVRSRRPQDPGEAVCDHSSLDKSVGHR